MTVSSVGSVSLPPSVLLLQLFTHCFQVSESVFKKDSPSFFLIYNTVQTSDYLDDVPELLQSQEIVMHIQGLMMACLSMLGGVHVPVIRDVHTSEGNCRITWDSGISDSFILGKWDDSFKQFIQYFQQRVFQHPSAKNRLPISVFRPMKYLLDSYILIIEALNQVLITLLHSPEEFMLEIKKKMSPEALFILISSLPPEQMNALFISIQQYFPSDLEVTTPTQNKVNVCSLFETSSCDIEFLIEKTHVYLDLYDSKKYPIISQITQNKTALFLSQSLQSASILSQTMETLKQLKHTHVDSRLETYSFLSSHLNQWI